MGVKLEVWKQGQFYPDLGKKVIELPYLVNSGPSDRQVRIDGFEVRPDHEGNYLKGNYSEDELDAINTYGTVRQVIDMYEQLLGETIKWSWQKNGINEPLSIRIRNNDINARFLRKQKCVELDYYGPYGNWIYNCRTVDLIAHEVGHAILDSILPHLNEGSPESRGIGEAFCDLVPMFLILSQKDLCEYIIKETSGDLQKESILSLFGVGHGYNHDHINVLRNANNQIRYNCKEWSPYHYSQVLVGLLYNLLIEMYNLNSKIHITDANNLYSIGQDWIGGNIMIYLDLVENELNLKNICRYLLTNYQLKNSTIKKHLKYRELL